MNLNTILRFLKEYLKNPLGFISFVALGFLIYQNERLLETGDQKVKLVEDAKDKQIGILVGELRYTQNLVEKFNNDNHSCYESLQGLRVTDEIKKLVEK